MTEQESNRVAQNVTYLAGEIIEYTKQLEETLAELVAEKAVLQAQITQARKALAQYKVAAKHLGKLDES